MILWHVVTALVPFCRNSLFFLVTIIPWSLKLYLSIDPWVFFFSTEVFCLTITETENTKAFHTWFEAHQPSSCLIFATICIVEIVGFYFFTILLCFVVKPCTCLSTEISDLSFIIHIFFLNIPLRDELPQISVVFFPLEFHSVSSILPFFTATTQCYDSKLKWCSNSFFNRHNLKLKWGSKFALEWIPNILLLKTRKHVERIFNN